MRYVGIDPALTATGMVVVDVAEDMGRFSCDLHAHKTVTTKPAYPLHVRLQLLVGIADLMAGYHRFGPQPNVGYL